MHQRTLTTRQPVHSAGWALVASAALALTLAACGPGPTNGEPPTGDVNIAVTVVGDGRATFSALGFDCSDSCTLVVDERTDVTLTAVANSEVLVAWDAPCSLFDTTCTWEATEDISVTVTFAPHALRFDLKGDGEGTFSFFVGETGEFVECDAACGIGLKTSQDVSISHTVDAGNRTELGPWEADCIGTERDDFCVVRVEEVTVVGKTWFHPPIAADHTYTTNQGTLLTVPEADGVLKGVDDTPDDTHTASRLTEPDNGTLTLSADGSFTYEPNAGFAGVDTFTFRVTDAFGNTDDGNATITVTATPAVTNVSIDQNDTTLTEGDSLQLSATVTTTGGASEAVNWSSNNTSVATVNSSGLVTALAEGTTTITATSNFDSTQSDSITITVTATPAHAG